MVGLKTVENKRSIVRYNKINITFPDWVIDENIIPRNMIINLGGASVDNHIPRDDIFDYHPIRECNIYILSPCDNFDYHMRAAEARTVRLLTPDNNGYMCEPRPGHFKLPITSLFVVKNIKCGYSFS